MPASTSTFTSASIVCACLHWERIDMNAPPMTSARDSSSSSGDGGSPSAAGEPPDPPFADELPRARPRPAIRAAGYCRGSESCSTQGCLVREVERYEDLAGDTTVNTQRGDTVVPSLSQRNKEK